MPVYLDYNATTPINPEVQETIYREMREAWGNPSSSYDVGKKAKSVIENARCKVSEMIGCKADEIIFTSGGTESNNMVIRTAIRHFNREANNGFTNSFDNNKPHIITTNIEHDSIKLPLEVLSAEGKIDVTFVPVSKLTGIIEIDDIMNEIRPNTCLITVMLANNETGIIQPVSLIRSQLDALSSPKTHRASPIFLHTDAAQALGKVNVDVFELDVDYLTIVGHKFYGPRIGALYCKHCVPLYPLLFGGGQEKSYRPGTENTCMIAGLGKAAELVTLNINEYKAHMTSMRNYLEKLLQDAFPGKVVFNVKSNVPRLPNTINVAFNYDKVTAQMLLSQAVGICASTGAACHSGEKSNILLASGVPDVLVSKSLRLSVGRETSEADIDIAIKILKQALECLLS